MILYYAPLYSHYYIHCAEWMVMNLYKHIVLLQVSAIYYKSYSRKSRLNSWKKFYIWAKQPYIWWCKMKSFKKETSPVLNFFLVNCTNFFGGWEGATNNFCFKSGHFNLKLYLIYTCQLSMFKVCPENLTATMSFWFKNPTFTVIKQLIRRNSELMLRRDVPYLTSKQLIFLLNLTFTWPHPPCLLTYFFNLTYQWTAAARWGQLGPNRMQKWWPTLCLESAVSDRHWFQIME